MKCKNCGNKKPFCSTCRSRQTRERDPIRASFVWLRNNAKRRGKVFTITLAYFRRFCYRTKYMKGKGRSADSYTVDRIIEELGYIPGNLQVLKNGANVRKYLNYDWQTEEARVVTVGRPKDKDDNLPF